MTIELSYKKGESVNVLNIAQQLWSYLKNHTKTIVFDSPAQKESGMKSMLSQTVYIENVDIKVIITINHESLNNT